MEYVYLACLLVAIGMMVWLKLYDVRNSVSQYLSLVTIIVSCFGYYFLAISRTYEEALFAQIIDYVGGVFLPIFYFFIVLEICHIELKEIIKVCLVLCQCFIYGFVCTIGRSELFYASVEVHEANGIVLLEKQYGPCHILAIGSMYLYLLCSFVAVLYVLIKKKSVDRKNAVTLLALMIIAVCVYVAQKAFDIEYEFIPVAFDVLMLGALIPIYDSNIYTVDENKNIVDEQLSEIGFLTFDKKKAYKGCNVCPKHR